MSDLVTAVNDLIKGRKVDENLHIYTEGLSSLYKRMAELRMAMNYFTFAEVFTEMNRETRGIIESSVDRIQKLVKNIVLYNELKEGDIEEISSFRDDLIRKMEILTSYTDRLQVVEYILNRVEYRFSDSGFSDAYYYDKFEQDIYHYITSDKDNSVINMKLSQVIAQIPMRLSKNKFFDMLKDSFSLYKESEKQSVDDFLYMIRTAGTLYKPEGFDTEFPVLNTYLEALGNINVETITADGYRVYREKLDNASALVEEYADFFVMITEVLNDVYSIALNFSALTDMNETDKLKDIISDSYDLIEGNDIDSEQISERFVLFEGLQEKLSSRIFNPESAMDEIININNQKIKELDYERTLENLSITSKLQSASTFARLKDNDTLNESADEAYVNEVTAKLISEFKEKFEQTDRAERRAIMALVISNLPAFFNNLEEFKKYVHVALSQCTDSAERQACMALINLMITCE